MQTEEEVGEDVVAGFDEGGCDEGEGCCEEEEEGGGEGGFDWGG